MQILTEFYSHKNACDFVSLSPIVVRIRREKYRRCRRTTISSRKTSGKNTVTEKEKWKKREKNNKIMYMQKPRTFVRFRKTLTRKDLWERRVSAAVIKDIPYKSDL